MTTHSTSMPTATWFKSSYSSGNTEEQCVETAGLGAVVGVRDSKNLAKGHFEVSGAAWGVFVSAIGH